MVARVFRLKEKQEIVFSAGILLGLMLLTISLMLTGAPYFAAAIALVVPVLIWACLKPKRLIYLLLTYCCVYPFLISDLGFPRLLSYGCDLLTAIAFIFSLRSEGLRKVRWGFTYYPVALFFTVALFSAVIHEVPPLLFVWEARNVFRFFVFLVACVGLLDRGDITRLLKILFIVFVVNIFICSFESLVLHYGQDNTNGLFGSGSGGNASTNILLLEMTCLALFGYGYKLVSPASLGFIIAGSCWLSIIAELKVYFVQLALLFALYLVISRPSLKNLCMAVLFVVSLWAFVQLFYALVPGWDGFFDLNTMVESSTQGGYGSSDGLNRLSAIATLQSMFLSDSSSSLFGLGFGAGTYSQFFAAPLYLIWGEVLHWTWFTDAQIFLETGYIGLMLYGLFFVTLGIHALRARRKMSSFEAAFTETGAIISFFCLMLLFYNCVLTVDPGGYLIFFFLAIPLIVERDRLSESQERGTSQWV